MGKGNELGWARRAKCGIGRVVLVIVAGVIGRGGKWTCHKQVTGVRAPVRTMVPAYVTMVVRVAVAVNSATHPASQSWPMESSEAVSREGTM